MFPNPQDALPLPRRPSLEQYKKLAKELVKACSATNPTPVREWIKHWIETLARLATPHVSLRTDDLVNQLEAFARNQTSEAKLSLAKAQFVIARRAIDANA